MPIYRYAVRRDASGKVKSGGPSLEDLDYRQLQQRARLHEGIPGNIPADELREAIRKAEAGE